MIFDERFPWSCRSILFYHLEFLIFDSTYHTVKPVVTRGLGAWLIKLKWMPLLVWCLVYRAASQTQCSLTLNGITR